MSGHIIYGIDKTGIQEKNREWHIVALPTIDDVWFKGITWIFTQKNNVCILSSLIFF